MAEGSLTAWFGEDLAFTLFRRVQHSRNGVDADAYRIAIGDLNGLTLMRRVSRIAEALGTVLPPDAASARDVLLSMLPPALGPSGKTFSDGYWVLPLAAYWPAQGVTGRRSPILRDYPDAGRR